MDKVLIVLVAGLIVTVIARMWLWRRAVRQVLSWHACDEPTMAAICTIVAEVNLTSPKHKFGVDRAANIHFRGQRVTLIYGSVGFPVGSAYEYPGWTFSTGCCYAVADENQIEWMKANSDAFSPAWIASPASVFWVKLAVLRANPPAQPTEPKPEG